MDGNEASCGVSDGMVGVLKNAILKGCRTTIATSIYYPRNTMLSFEIRPILWLSHTNTHLCYFCLLPHLPSCASSASFYSFLQLTNIFTVFANIFLVFLHSIVLFLTETARRKNI